jgi:hypothetical protein
VETRRKRRVAQKLHLKFAPWAGIMLMRIGSEGRGERGEGGIGKTGMLLTNTNAGNDEG